MEKQFVGLMLGSAIGDAVGLPLENVAPIRAQKIFTSSQRPFFIKIPFGKGFSMCSDDTDHLWITAKALLQTQQQTSNEFANALASLMKRWILSLPIGVGRATMKACIKLLFGVSPGKSGIASAGNGTAMRAAIIGAFYAHDETLMEQYIISSSKITHNDPKAIEGALVIAKAAAYLCRHHPKYAPIDEFFNLILPQLKGEQLHDYLSIAHAYLKENASLAEYLAALNLDKTGVSGYINHTVPAVIYAWLSHFNDYEQTITTLVHAGGDTDTTAAIAGALAGITAGKEGIPVDWMSHVANAPLSLSKIEQLAILLTKKQNSTLQVAFLPLLMRNIALNWIVVFRSIRLLFPPY